MTPYKSKLLRKDTMVRRDIFVRLEPDALESLLEAWEQGLKPSGFEAPVDNIVILRLDRNESRKPLQEE